MANLFEKHPIQTLFITTLFIISVLLFTIEFILRMCCPEIKALGDKCHDIVDTLKCQYIEDSPRCPDTLHYEFISAYS